MFFCDWYAIRCSIFLKAISDYLEMEEGNTYGAEIKK